MAARKSPPAICGRAFVCSVAGLGFSLTGRVSADACLAAAAARLIAPAALFARSRDIAAAVEDLGPCPKPREGVSPPRPRIRASP
jgi:hypothetical protein